MLDDTDFLGPDERVVPSWTEPLAKQASRLIGGPLGTRAAVGRHWFFSPLRIVLLFAIVFLMLGFFTKADCIQQENSNGQVILDILVDPNKPYDTMCYSDTVMLYGDEKLDQGLFPYLNSWQEQSKDANGNTVTKTRYMEYPVLTGLFQWGNAKLTQWWQKLGTSSWFPTGPPVAIYFDISCFFLAIAWLITVWAVTRTARSRPWDAVLVALSPLVIDQAFTNFDTLATAFAATGILAWSRRKPMLAGVLLGLGGAAKLYPLFLLLPILLLCIRAGRVKYGIRAIIAAIVAWLAVNVPIAVNFSAFSNGGAIIRPGWWEFFGRNIARGADLDSLYNVVSGFTGWQGFDAPGGTPHILNAVSFGLFGLCCVAIAWLALSAPTRPRLAQLCFLVVAAFLLTNKVWSPQYSLWLVPLAALAIPRWRLIFAWMTIDAAIWVPRMFYYLENNLNAQGQPDRGLPPQWFYGFVIVRDLAVLGLCALIVREVYQPWRDKVRALGEDDPAGGVLADAPDRRVLRKPVERGWALNPAASASRTT
ncbi:MAG: DUF2029 domain-containing protein [Sciscionella sp.]|nr:DUF2029 domain-containing protein [Sciscionella sp.]